MGTNGFFGNIQGPFSSGVNIVNIISQNCVNFFYISKIGFCYTGDPQKIKNINIEIKNENQNNVSFQIGKTGMLELEDVRITEIHFSNNVDDKMYIDYQYVQTPT